MDERRRLQLHLRGVGAAATLSRDQRLQYSFNPTRKESGISTLSARLAGLSQPLCDAGLLSEGVKRTLKQHAGVPVVSKPSGIGRDEQPSRWLFQSSVWQTGNRE